ncbi:MAG: protein-glutamate O-methyltransferase CheR [Spirochaetales bacterium]|nr:protein-glutamate O-methyltransferase CheR [Spirochaetales bacterium]
MVSLNNSRNLDGLLDITRNEFEKIAELVYDNFGINLTDSKVALVRGRLNKIIKDNGFKSFKAYYEAVVGDPTGRSLLSMIDRLSTNHSFLFREKEHFDYLRICILPELVRKMKCNGEKEIRIWCAGCAGGEEAYSLAFILDEFFGFTIGEWDIGILATDISDSALHDAITGEYPYEKVKHVPPHLMNKYLKKNKENIYKVDNRMKRMILFKRLNLMSDTFPFKKKFHIIFLRNVMIYFDQKTRESLVKKLYRHMEPHSYIFIGHSESLGRVSGDFEYMKPAVYRRI